MREEDAAVDEKMTTRDRVLRYAELRKASKERADKFLEENREDERFVSLVELGNSFIDGLIDAMLPRSGDR